MKRTRDEAFSSSIPPLATFSYYGNEYLWLPELSYIIFQFLDVEEESPAAISLALTCKRDLAIFKRVHGRQQPQDHLFSMMASRAFRQSDRHLWAYATLEQQRQRQQARLLLDEKAQMLALLMPGVRIDMAALSKLHYDNVCTASLL